ncbi:hypothetical protein OUZ56_015952 [Daphnia magna]|uniref:Uncharacterized protein n=1 Tax=Daphnia magna TaxID=35525 RepID=A0ABR0AP85_9CRUS|nr:hypothetical protein OUZ56_015952 [Daphnia magna]
MQGFRSSPMAQIHNPDVLFNAPGMKLQSAHDEDIPTLNELFASAFVTPTLQHDAPNLSIEIRLLRPRRSVGGAH